MTDQDLDNLMKRVLNDSIQLDLELDATKDAPAFDASPQHQHGPSGRCLLEEWLFSSLRSPLALAQLWLAAQQRRRLL